MSGRGDVEDLIDHLQNQVEASLKGKEVCAAESDILSQNEADNVSVTKTENVGTILTNGDLTVPHDPTTDALKNAKDGLLTPTNVQATENVDEFGQEVSDSDSCSNYDDDIQPELSRESIPDELFSQLAEDVANQAVSNASSFLTNNSTTMLDGSIASGSKYYTETEVADCNVGSEKRSMLQCSEQPKTSSNHEGNNTPDANESMPNACDQKGVNDHSEESEWLDVLGNGQLKKKVIKMGLGHETRPVKGQEVTIEMDSLLAHKPEEKTLEKTCTHTFVLGEEEAPSQAIDLAVALMENGETCKVVSDPKYANHQSQTEIVKENVTYNITLIDIKDGPYNANTPIEKRLEWVNLKKTAGNKLYSNKDFVAGIAAYKKCLKVLHQAKNQQHPDELKTEIKQLAVKCYNNLAASHMMVEDWKASLASCNAAEAIDGDSIKTLLRKGKTLGNLGELKQAIATLKKASELDPSDNNVQNELAKQIRKLSAQTEAEKKMYQRMFGGPAPSNEENPEVPKASFFSWGSQLVVGGSVAFASVLLALYLYHR